MMNCEGASVGMNCNRESFVYFLSCVGFQPVILSVLQCTTNSIVFHYPGVLLPTLFVFVVPTAVVHCYDG